MPRASLLLMIVSFSLILIIIIHSRHPDDSSSFTRGQFYPVPPPCKTRCWQASLAHDPVNQAINNMICLAFYFLLRPSKYMGTASETHHSPTKMWNSTSVISHLIKSLNGLGRSGDPHFCPVTTTAQPFLHLRHTTAQPTQPLALYTVPTTHQCAASPSRISQPSSVWLCNSLAQPTAFFPRISPPSPCGLWAQWPSFALTLTVIKFYSLAVGAQTKCSATSTSKPNPSCVTFPPIC